MQNIALIIPFHNQLDLTNGCVSFFLSHSRGPVNLLLIDNGSDESCKDKILQSNAKFKNYHDIRCIRFEDNIGVFPTFKAAFTYLKDTDIEWFFFTHNDVVMCEIGWDEKLDILLSKLKNPGVCGFFGATQLGTSDIYRTPYHLMQLQRWDCWTGLTTIRYGGLLLQKEFKEVAVLDGFALIINRKVLERICNDESLNGFPVHHMYDNLICIESHFAGFKNYVLNFNCDHLGGRTSCYNDGEYAKQFGTTDFEIHRMAHEMFYERYRGRLPVRICNAD